MQWWKILYLLGFMLYFNDTIMFWSLKSLNQIKIKSNHFIVTSPQHKCLGEWNSYERAPDSAKRNNNNNLHMDRQCKKTTNNLHMDRQCKKTTNNLHMDRQCKKAALEHLQCSRQCKKKQQQFTYGQTVQKKQQQFTYGQYIFTDCTEDNVQNTHTYTQYT